MPLKVSILSLPTEKAVSEFSSWRWCNCPQTYRYFIEKNIIVVEEYYISVIESYFYNMINCRVTWEDLQSLLEQQRCLDHRQLEEGFLLYAALQTMSKYDLWAKIAFIPTERNEMAEL